MQSLPSLSRLALRFGFALVPLGLASGCDTRPDDRPSYTSHTTGSPFDSDGATEDAGHDSAVFPPDDAQTFPDVPVWEGTNFEPNPVPVDTNFRVVSRSPEPDAVDVAGDVRIEVAFSHDLRANNLPSVTLTRQRDSQRLDTTVRVEGASLWVEPTSSLEPGETHSLRLGTVWPSDDDRLDLLYESEWDSEWSFTVAQAEGTIVLSGPLSAIAYDGERARLWGTAREARELVLVDLEAGEEVARRALTYVPSSLCVSPDGSSVFIANRGTSLVTEVQAETREVVRQIAWPGTDDGAQAGHLHVHCTEDRLWLVDAATDPALWSVDLTQPTPAAVSHAVSVTGVGDLALSPDGSTLYYGSQAGWGPQLGLEVRAVDTDSFALQDSVVIGPSVEREVALDAPLFFDASDGRVVTRNRVLRGDDLAIVLFTFPEGVVLRAVDYVRDRAASLDHVYSLERYRAETQVLTSAAEHVFFDQEGVLNIVVNEPAPKLLRQTFEEAM